MTIAAMGAGLLIGLFREDFARSWTFYGIGCVGAALLTLYSHWTGYYGALLLAAYLMAAAVPLIGSAARKSPATTFGLGFLVYNFMLLFHVWVVAYAFVPGGPLVREHTDWVMTTTMLLIGCGVFSAVSSNPTVQKKRPNAYFNSRRQRSYYLYVLGFLPAALCFHRVPALPH